MTIMVLHQMLIRSIELDLAAVVQLSEEIPELQIESWYAITQSLSLLASQGTLSCSLQFNNFPSLPFLPHSLILIHS